MNSAARRIARRKAFLREALRRLGLVLVTVALMSTLVLADRLGAAYRAAYGHLIEQGEK